MREDLSLCVRSPIGAICLESTVGLDWTIGDVKAALAEQTGTPQGQQRLTLRKLKGSLTQHSTLADGESLCAVLAPGCGSLTLELSRNTDEQVRWLRRVRAQPNALKDAPEIVKNDHEVAHLAVQQLGSSLQWLSAEMQADRVIVMAAVRQAGGSFAYAAEALRGDRGFVLEAATANVGAICFASAELLEDKDFLLSAVERRVGTFGAMPAHFRCDREFVLEAVRRRGEALRCATPELRGDRDLVLEAVAQDGSALEFASAELRCDKEVVLAAIGQSAMALQHAGPLVLVDAEVVLLAVQKCGAALNYAALMHRSDPDIVLAAIHPQSSGSGDEEGGESPSSASWASSSGAAAIEFAAPKLRDDPIFITQACQRHPDALRFASVRLRAYPEFGRAALAGDFGVAKHFVRAAHDSDSEEGDSFASSSDKSDPDRQKDSDGEGAVSYALADDDSGAESP